MNALDIPDDDTGHAIRRWMLNGSDLTRPMKIDFFVSVADEVTGANIASDSALEEFAISIEKDEETGKWTCYCTKVMMPDYRAIMDVEDMLVNMAQRYGADYEGFGSFGNAVE